MRAELFNLKIVEEGDTLTDNLFNGVLHKVYNIEGKGLCVKKSNISFQPLPEFFKENDIQYIIKPV